MSAALATLKSATQRSGPELVAFVAWWLAELRETWLEAFERLAPQRARRFLVHIGEHGGAIDQIGGAAAAAPQHFSLAENGGLPATTEFWNGTAPVHARAFAALPESSVLICHLRLPPLRDSDVDSVVELQLARELPLPADQVYIDWEIEQQYEDRSRRVAVAIARRTEVDRLREALQSWGWNVLAIGLSGNDDRWRFNLLPRRARGVNFALGKREWLLLASAVALGVAYGAAVFGQWWFERASLAEPLQQARAQMTQIRGREKELQSLAQSLVALSAVMQSKSSVDALTAMSSSIPTDTWVYRAEIRTPAAELSQIKLEAYTPAATAFIERLRSSEVFEQIQLVETAAAAPEFGGERIGLTAQLKEGRP